MNFSAIVRGVLQQKKNEIEKFFFGFICSAIILMVLSARYFSDFKTFQTGKKLLLPVKVENVETNAFSSLVRLRYFNFIPVDALEKETEAVVVSHSDDGQVTFVSKETGERLRPHEMLLKYTIMPPSLLKREKKGSDVRFAASKLRFSKDKQLQPFAVCYAVVRANDDGKTFLTGLTDCSGTQLIKGLASSDRRNR
ncbi:MAG: hypothetical protein IKR09_00120 [Alphaproteobacteria bacterium]|nr:hypothetical protein [Alphaproteobacteria bacterium]